MQNFEYEFQLFGFTIEQQSLERRLKVRKVLNDALESVIRKSSSSNETVRLLLTQKASVSHSLLLTLEEDIKYLEALDKKVFTVPRHVLLESDFQYKKQCTEESEEYLDTEISELSQLYLENRVFSTLLEAEEGNFNLVKPFIDDQIKMYAEFKQCLNCIGSLSPMSNKAKDLMDKM